MERINLGDFLPNLESDYLNGGCEGENTRRILKLDEKDRKNIFFEVHISERIVGINISFFSGLFSESIVTYGEIDFYKHYKFTYENEDVEKLVKGDIAEGVKNNLWT